MAKKIIFVIPTLGSGGAERVVSSLANELVERGYNIGVVLVISREQKYEIDSRIKIYSLDCIEDQNKITAKRYLRRFNKLRRILKQLAPDVVVSFLAETNIDVCLSAIGLKIPVIVSERNDPAVEPAGRIKQILRKFAYLRANGFVFQTPDAQAYFSRRIQRKSTIILNPLTSTIADVFRGEREKRIVAVGRLDHQKNYPVLFEAFRNFSEKNPGYTLDVFGQGPLKQSLLDQIHAMKLEGLVTLKGFCADVHNEIRKAGIYVMSSDFEGMPNTLIEAMAMGLPCISTDCPCGGPRVLIDHGKNGVLVPVGDAVALENAMCSLAADSTYAARLGRAAELLRNRVDIGTVSDQWIEFINTVDRT